MAIGDIYQLATIGKAGNKAAVNVYHYQQTSAHVQTFEEEDLATAWYEKIWSTLSLQLSDFYLLELIRVYNVASQAAPFELAVNELGGVAQEAGPNQNAAVFSWKTLKRGPSFRGRNYIAGIPEIRQTGSVIDAGSLGQLQLIVDAMIVIAPDTNHGGYDLGVYSRKLLEFNKVTSGIAKAVAGTVRNRRPAAN